VTAPTSSAGSTAQYLALFGVVGAIGGAAVIGAFLFVWRQRREKALLQPMSVLNNQTTTTATLVGSSTQHATQGGFDSSTTIVSQELGM
jgi:hypothetical protein